MPVFNYPYIRDILTIDDRVQRFYNDFAGDGAVFLLGRVVRHAPGCDLRVGSRPLIIVADVYDGTGGMIDARGADATAVGARGADGVYPWPDAIVDSAGVDRPIGPGGGGQGGGPGAPGGNGGTVTVRCRRSVNAHISAAGGNGAAGGAGGNGSRGVGGHIIPDQTVTVDDTPDDPSDFSSHEEFIPGETIAGTPGGDGGGGGTGGAGGNGGAINFTSIVDDTPPTLEARGGAGAPGGPGGAAGLDGNLSPTTATEGSAGSDGGAGLDGQVTQTNISEPDYVAGLRSVLDFPGASYANHWAPFRIVTGEYFYHRHNASLADRAHYSQLAAIEFARALELQPDNGEALRLQAQLVGVPQAVEGTDDVVWVGGGNNALGLPPDLDVLPNFDAYINAFTGFGALTLGFMAMGTSAILEQETLSSLGSLVELQRQDAVAARENINDDLGIAVSEKKLASDEADYVQQQLDQTTSEIEAALAEMRESEFSFGDFLGTVAEIGVAIVSVAAAIPSGGASLVALVPAMVALADTAIADAEPIAKALLAGTDPDIKAIEDAYKKVDKNASAVVKAGKSISNFVTVVQRLSASTTPDNSKHVALVKRGAELTHQVLLARNRVTLAQQRIDATQAKLSRAAGVVAQAEKLRNELAFDAASIRRAGLLAIGVAQSRADALLDLAFRAQRSVEIYTLQDEEQHLVLDAGLLSPDVVRAYYEEEIREGDLVAELTTSWGQLLKPLEIQSDYVSYFDQAHDQDRHRLSFTAGDPELSALKTRGRFSFRVDASGLAPDRADAKARSVRLALVGASHPNGEVSCEVRHGGRYEQRRADGTIAVQLLEPRVSTRPAKLTRLAADEGLGADPPLTAPQSLAFWGRGIGGDWEVSIPASRLNSGLDLTGLTEIQVWIGYQFLR
jgi:hypothetical protein